MKKFTLKAIALATASVCGSAAFAGTVTAPAAPITYAVEAMTATTDITLPNLVYTMGVDRTATQDFTVIITAPAGSAIIPASCATAVPSFGIGFAGSPAATVKRASASECAYEIDIDTLNADGATAGATATLTFSGIALTSHTLATAGTELNSTIALKDLGESAFIDNSGALTVEWATSAQAVTITATQDALTKADVNNGNGPLFGFVAANDDTADTATATFVINNNPDDYVTADGVTPFDFASEGTSLTLTFAGDFSGLDTDGFTLVYNGNTYVADVAGGVATVEIPAADFPNNGNDNASASFLSSLSVSLGVSRTFGVNGVSDSAVGANQNVAGGNASWWVWGANASQLMTPFFNTNVNYITRFFFLNTSDADVSWTAQCYTEGGNAVSNGAGGTLAAAATTNVPASAACTFPAATPRGAVIFTINAPIGAIKGTFQQISPTGADGVVQPLVRPYTPEATTE